MKDYDILLLRIESGRHLILREFIRNVVISGGRYSGICLALKEIVSSVNRPISKSGRTVPWDAAYVTFKKDPNMRGWFNVIEVK